MSDTSGNPGGCKCHFSNGQLVGGNHGTGSLVTIDAAGALDRGNFILVRSDGSCTFARDGEENARRTYPADIRKLPGDTVRLGDRQSSGDTSARDLEQSFCHSCAHLLRPVGVSTGLEPGRLPILRRTGAMPSIVTSVTLLGDRRITILSSGG